MPSLPVAWFNLNRKGRKEELREGGREGKRREGKGRERGRR